MQWSLARPISSENNNQIQVELENKGCDSARLGIEDRNIEGQWNYMNNYKNWASGEPNNMGNEDCTEMRKHDGKWNDIQCTVMPACFVCSDHKESAAEAELSPSSSD